MIYLKIPKEEIGFHIHECKDEFKIDIYDDFFYSKCPICGKSVKVELEDILHVLEIGEDFNTSICCEKCSNKN